MDSLPTTARVPCIFELLCVVMSYSEPCPTWGFQTTPRTSEVGSASLLNGPWASRAVVASRTAPRRIVILILPLLIYTDKHQSFTRTRCASVFSPAFFLHECPLFC